MFEWIKARLLLLCLVGACCLTVFMLTVLALGTTWEYNSAFIVWWVIVGITIYPPLTSFNLLKHISNIREGKIAISFILSGMSYWFSYKSSLNASTCSTAPGSEAPMHSLFCATFPNIVAGVFVALIGAGALLYPLHQQRESIRSRNRALIAKMCQLSGKDEQVVLGASKLPSALLPSLVIPGTAILASFAVLLYILTLLSFKATIMLVSLVVIYLIGVVFLIIFKLMSTITEPDYDTTTTALNLLLSSAIRTPQCPLGELVICPDSLELYEEVKSKLSTFIDNAGAHASGLEMICHLKLIDKVVEDQNTRTLTIYPFTADKALDSKLLVAFRSKVYTRRSILESRSYAVDETRLAIIRHTFLQDCRLLVKHHMPDSLDSEQEALAVFLMLCGNNCIREYGKGKIKKMPTTNQTVESLGTYFGLNADPCWYTLPKIEDYDKLTS